MRRLIAREFGLVRLFKFQVKKRVIRSIPKGFVLLRDDDFREKVKRIISKRTFIIKSARDLEEAFKFANTEEGEARLQPGRVLVYLP